MSSRNAPQVAVPPVRFQEMFPSSVPKNKRAQEKWLGKGPSCPWGKKEGKALTAFYDVTISRYAPQEVFFGRANMKKKAPEESSSKKKK